MQHIEELPFLLFRRARQGVDVPEGDVRMRVHAAGAVEGDQNPERDREEPGAGSSRLQNDPGWCKVKN